jgi:hypothetical protein
MPHSFLSCSFAPACDGNMSVWSILTETWIGLEPTTLRNCFDEIVHREKLTSSTLMDSNKREPSESEADATTSQDPISGSTSVTKQSSANPRRDRVLAFTVVGLLIALPLVAWLIRRQQSPIVPGPSRVEQKVDLEALKAKAEAGDAASQAALGDAYAKGHGVAASYVEAAKWYLKAAEQGNAHAQTALGELCEVGQGVPRDEAQAAAWYRRAAEQGHAVAQYSLATLYTVGKGVAQDNAEALKWYRQAASKGDALAQYNLGMRYYEGKGLPPDPIEAYKWLSLAIAQGVDDAKPTLENLKRKMNRDQIREGTRLAAAFTSTNSPAPKSAQ